MTTQAKHSSEHDCTTARSKGRGDVPARTVVEWDAPAGRRERTSRSSRGAIRIAMVGCGLSALWLLAAFGCGSSEASSAPAETSTVRRPSTAAADDQLAVAERTRPAGGGAAGPAPEHACSRDEDCALRCRDGAVSRDYHERLESEGVIDCRDGCSSVAHATRCEDGLCVAYRMSERDDNCTEQPVTRAGGADAPPP